MINMVRSTMQVVSSRGKRASIAVRRTADRGIVTITSTEVSEGRVYTEKARLAEKYNEITSVLEYDGECHQESDNRSRSTMQAVTCLGERIAILIERDTASGAITATFTEVLGMQVYTEKTELTGIDDAEVHSHPWVTDFNTSEVGANV